MAVSLLNVRERFEQHLALDDCGRTIATYDDFRLESVFQPIVDRDEQLVAYEALLRIHSVSTHHEVPPETLFHTPPTSVDELNHQTNLDRLSRVIHLRNFAAVKLEIPLHLNMLPSSALQAFNDQLSQSLMYTRARELGMDHKNIIYEVTEDYQHDEAALSSATAHMRANGFQISVDDFGTGSSSLARVRALAPSILKLDRELVTQFTGGNTKKLFEAIRVAKEISAVTVAEGIENRAQFEAVRAANVDYFQGFYFGHPLPLRGAYAPLPIHLAE